MALTSKERLEEERLRAEYFARGGQVYKYPKSERRLEGTTYFATITEARQRQQTAAKYERLYGRRRSE